MIDFGKPFKHAYAHTSKVLFQPFEFTKWLTLGFTAWLASFLGGAGGGGGNSFSNLGGNHHDGGTNLLEKLVSMGLPFWLLILALIALLIGFITFIFIALGCRGQFIFLHNVLNNKAEVKKPWKEYSRQANELTLWHFFLSIIPMLMIFILMGFALAYFWPFIISKTFPTLAVYLPWILALVGFGLLIIPLSLFLFFLHDFGVPIMAKHRCSMLQTVKHLGHLLRTRFLDCIIYLLIRFGMGVIFVIGTILIGCLTCCIGFLPYISTVLTLPYHVFRQSYALNCLAQFGSDYDLWPVALIPPPIPPLPGEA
ncbi:MAG: hypothetical protein SH807_07490 [Blastochloris sp.]|nr:hypothetical protein [Blastochloris sp.]